MTGGGGDEERDEMLICSFVSYLPKSTDVLLSFFQMDGKKRMSHSHQDIIADKATGTAIAVAERMEIFKETVEARDRKSVV